MVGTEYPLCQYKSSYLVVIFGIENKNIRILTIVTTNNLALTCLRSKFHRIKTSALKSADLFLYKWNTGCYGNLTLILTRIYINKS